MAQIYEEKAQVKRQSLPVDTAEMEYFNKKANFNLGNVEKWADETIQVETKRRVEQEKSLMDLTELQASTVYKNAIELYPYEPGKYSEYVSKGLKEVYDAVPDSDGKRNIMAKVAINGSNYDAKVASNKMDKDEKVSIDRVKELTTDKMQRGIAGLQYSYLSEKMAADMTPEERLEWGKNAIDAQVQMKEAYNTIYNARDRRGNAIYSDTDRAWAKEAYENREVLGMTEYIAAYADKDYEGCAKLINDFSLGEDEVSRQKTEESKKDMQAVLEKRVTPQQLIANKEAQIKIAAKANEIGLDDGKVKGKYNNLNASVDYLNETEQAYENGVYLKEEEKKKGRERLVQASMFFADQIESEFPRVEGQRRWWDHLFKAEPNASEQAIIDINTSLSDLQEASGMDDDTMKIAKKDMYKQVFGQAQESGQNMKSKKAEDKEAIRQLSNAAFINQTERLLGADKVKEVAARYKGNQTGLRQALLAEVQNKKAYASQDNIDRQLQ